MLVSEIVSALSPRVTVLAGASALSANVRWVHPTDLSDPSPYLRGGELVLTNGQWRRTPADSRRFVRVLVDAGVCAIGYGLQTPGTHTPKDLVTACNRAGLPLIEIPHDMAFVEISELVATHQAERRQRRLVRRVRRDQALLTSVTGGAGSGQILEILALDYGAEFLLVDHAGQIVAGAPAVADRPIDGHHLAVAVSGVDRQTAIEVGGRAATAFPVVAHGAIEAVLICFRGIDELTDDERSAIEHELVFVGLDLSQALATRELSERLVDELPEMIAAGEARSSELVGRLRSLGLDAAHPLSVIVFVAESDGAPARRVARIAVRLLAARGIPSVAPVAERAVLVIASLDGDPAALAADLTAALVRENLEVSVGVGSTVGPGARELSRSVAEGRVAADYARARHGPGGLATYAEAGSFRVLLAGLDGRHTQVAFARAVLGPVLAQDRERGTQLLDTLDAFLRDGGHWQRVADALHLHVNTLRYRIARVEQLTGRSLSTFEERVNFYLALEALRERPEARLEEPPS